MAPVTTVLHYTRNPRLLKQTLHTKSGVNPLYEERRGPIGRVSFIGAFKADVIDFYGGDR